MRRNSLPTPRILMYHAITQADTDPHRVCVSPRRFAEQIRHLARRRFRGVSVGELLRGESDGDRRRLVGLTFDDGFENFMTHALPILEEVAFGATLFVLPSLLGGQNVWDPDGPTLPLVSEDQVRELDRRGVEIGCHSGCHSRLSELGDIALRKEVADSRQHLAAILGHEVDGFCYPYGDHDGRVTAAVRQAGYGYACAYLTHASWTRHTLPRMHVGERDGGARLDVKLLVYDRLQRVRRRAGMPRPVVREVGS